MRLPSFMQNPRKRKTSGAERPSYSDLYNASYLTCASSSHPLRAAHSWLQLQEIATSGQHGWFSSIQHIGIIPGINGNVDLLINIQAEYHCVTDNNGNNRRTNR